MLKLLASDFYKLFSRKSFYICALIGMFIAVINVLTLSYQMGSQYGIPDLDLKMLGYNAMLVITSGAAAIGLVTTIFSSIFVSTEFSTGMVRTVLLRGANRFAFYFSKLIVIISVPIIFTILSCGASFAAGCYLWGMGEPTQTILIGIAKSLGMFLMVQAALHSIYVMIAFLTRSTGTTVSVNLAVFFPLIPTMLIWLVEFVLSKWFDLHKNIGEYWIGNYSSVFEQTFFSKDYVIKILAVSTSYFVVSTLIGCFTFWKRDIK
ncbi:MAG: ABC transporter permease [Oscillospiraceae bacterium]|jgi:ABC-type transport system involved in multi-copper enzyme maturation permease subunit|nr:ABC transporter permease [Oscillospiraceae bacterium]